MARMSVWTAAMPLALVALGSLLTWAGNITASTVLLGAAAIIIEMRSSRLAHHDPALRKER